MKKFWVVHNIPSPYRLHIFNALWKESKMRGVDFHVHFMSDMSRGYDERPLNWRNPKMDFPYTYWRDYGIGQRHVNPGLLLDIWRNQPDYLLVGSPFDTLTGMLAGRMIKHGVACTWCEGNARRPGKMHGILGGIKRFALSGYPYVAVPGEQGVRYIALHQGMTRRKMPKCVMLPNLVDESLFNVTSMRSLRLKGMGPAAELRQKLGCGNDSKLCIVPSRIAPVKGVIEFLSCLSTTMLRGWKIVVVGDGPLRDEAETLIGDRGLCNHVVINGFVRYEEMPTFYAAADLLLLPSLQDQNPLAVVEGLHSGLAIAESDQAGNVDEAVSEGENGWVLPVSDREEFIGTLKRVFSTDLAQLMEMGRKSKEVNAQFWNTGKSVYTFCSEIMS